MQIRPFLYGRRMDESMVYWETAHTVPNLPHFLRDWTRLMAGSRQDRLLQDPRRAAQRANADRARVRSRRSAAAQGRRPPRLHREWARGRRHRKTVLSGSCAVEAGIGRRTLSAVRCPWLIEVKWAPMNRWSPYLLSILRIIAAFVYMVHGTQKLFGFPAPFPVPHLPPLFLAGGIIETFGGSLLSLGLFTRPVA
jgi:hypothetical protein